MHLSDVLLSLSGVIAIVALVWWAMGSAVARIADEAAARARIAWDHPDFVVGQLIIAADGRDAIALSADGREVILLFALGKRITCWRMAREQLRAEERASPPTLVLTTGDFTLPRLRLSGVDAARGHELASRLASGAAR